MTTAASMLYCIPAGLLLCALAELMHRSLHLGAALRWIGGHLPLYLSASIPLWALPLALCGVTGSFVLGVLAAYVIVGILAYTEYLMLFYRDEPLTPNDLKMAMNIQKVLSMISPVSVFLLFAGLILTGVIGFALYEQFPSAHLAPVSRVVCSSVGFLVLGLFLCAGRPKSPARALMKLAGAEWASFRRSGNHKLRCERNGFVASFFSQFLTPLVERPADYSEESVARITARYKEENSAAVCKPRRPHVLFIMSEAFSDPTRIEGVRLSADPIPETREIMRRFPSGYVLAPGYGGGTAHTEFEALTGLSITLTGGLSAYENNTCRHDSFPSIARRFLEEGYHTVALHPYKPGMYARKRAYPALGFEKFLDVSHMRHLEKPEHNPFVGDAAAYAEAYDLMKESDAPLFLHLVTMQNHGDYHQRHRFENTIRAESETLNGKDIRRLETYAQGLRHTDRATREFLDRLDGCGEDVAVVFWGDHLPGLYHSSSFGGWEITRFETPFFIWANFELPQIDYGARSPMMLPSLLTQVAHLAPTPFDRMMLELQGELRAVHTRFVLDAAGVPLHHSDIPLRAQALLEQLRTVQYDAMIGQKYAQQQGFYRPSKP